MCAAWASVLVATHVTSSFPHSSSLPSVWCDSEIDRLRCPTYLRLPRPEEDRKPGKWRKLTKPMTALSWPQQFTRKNKRLINNRRNMGFFFLVASLVSSRIVGYLWRIRVTGTQVEWIGQISVGTRISAVTRMWRCRLAWG